MKQNDSSTIVIKQKEQDAQNKNRRRPDEFLDATKHLYKRSFPSIGQSVGRSGRRSVPWYFWMTNMAGFECEMSSNDTINNSAMSDDEVVASDIAPRYML